MNGIHGIKDVLEAYKTGKISEEEAERMLKGEMVGEIEKTACLDLFRELRTGIPEIVFAESKSDDDLASIISKFLSEKGIAILSRVTQSQVHMIQAKFQDSFTFNEKARMAVVTGASWKQSSQAGTVGIITAGTSDIPVAEEAATICEVMGCTVVRAFDIGIAGIHRVFKPLKDMIEKDVDVLVVCAGMEGALPSIIASMTDVLVIGVPIATGYGFGGQGTTALSSMLQSCAPGLVVVNINNGIGAGSAAAL
nr:nickel pincer cofactor biosynthesis protein LarB [Candidatus Sigynarchaeota archaeon]